MPRYKTLDRPQGVKLPIDPERKAEFDAYFNNLCGGNFPPDEESHETYRPAEARAEAQAPGQDNRDPVLDTGTTHSVGSGWPDDLPIIPR